jgi:hypothetical protein
VNFLQLCQRAASECGSAGSGPTAVTGQVGEALRIVNWVNDSWLDLQSLHEDWKFMRMTASWTTVNGQPTYTPAECNATNFGNWFKDTFRNYDTAAGIASEIFMPYLEYEAWRNTYQYGGMRFTETRPVQMSVAPDESICLGPYPSDGWTCYGDYFSVPAYMTEDESVPGLLPERYQMIIVYDAMMRYGAFYSAPEVYQRGLNKYREMKGRLEINQLPDIRQADPLA